MPATGRLAALTLAAAATAAGPVVADDGAVRADVERRFTQQGLDDGAAVAARVEEGVVVLRGEAPHLLAAERAVEIAAATREVRAVVDRLDVAPAADAADRGDAELQAAVELALLAEPATEAAEVVVDVSAGVATLVGAVESRAEASTCVRLARGVPGLQAVEDRLELRPRAERSDEELRDEVLALLRFDPWLDAGAIEVDVRQAVVTLRGEVPSLQQRARARYQAWVIGADGVDLTGLRTSPVDPLVRTDEPSDAEAAVALRDALHVDDRIGDAGAIDVTVADGVATLRGVLPSAVAERAALADARHTVGVWRVEDRLRVEADDAALRRAVEEALAAEPLLADEPVAARVVAGWVVLTGEVETEAQRRLAEEVAARVDGVVGVRCSLTIRPLSPEEDPVLEADAGDRPS